MFTQSNFLYTQGSEKAAFDFHGNTLSEPSFEVEISGLALFIGTE